MRQKGKLRPEERDPYVAEIARIAPVKSWHSRVYGHDATPLPSYMPIDVIGGALERVAADVARQMMGGAT